MQRPLLALALTALWGCQPPPPQPEPMPRPMPMPQPMQPELKPAVATYDDEATKEALAVLAEGGNACDAYVAATLVLYVRAAGYTSLAGPMSALVFDAKSGAVDFIDGSFNQPQHATAASDALGRGMLVPGAPAALFALHARACSLPIARLFRRAVSLARDGFPLGAEYAYAIEYSRAELERSEYGRRTFFVNGKPLARGEVLRQPEVAALLERLAAEGAEHMYRGAWAQAFLAEAARLGSALTAADFEAYRAEWRAPHSVTYRGRTLYSGSGRTMGGLQVLLALKVLEHADLTGATHPSRSADTLELLVRVWRAVSEEYAVYDLDTLDSTTAIAELLGKPNVDRLWRNAESKLSAPARVLFGSHSQTVTVIDRWGNSVTGINTIQSFPWGDGVFVEGVPLPSSGRLELPGTPLGRRLDTIAVNLAVRDGRLSAAGSTFNFSLREAAFQMWTNLIDFNLPVDEALSLPRFGTFVFRADGSVDSNSQYVDPLVPKALVDELRARGVNLEQTAEPGTFLDTGLGTAATLENGQTAAAVMSAP